MTQKIFDTDNEEDMALLWSILPECIYKITKSTFSNGDDTLWYSGQYSFRSFLKINWHEKTEITRPIQEATEQDRGKLCVFWGDDKSRYDYGILTDYYKLNDCKYVRDKRVYSAHCRRLTKQEIEELC